MGAVPLRLFFGVVHYSSHACILGAVQGTLIAGRYRLIEECGRGGVGVVFRARDEETQSLVAVKCGTTQLEREVARHLAATAGSPLVVRIHTVLEFEEGDFLISDYVPGPTLAAELLLHGPLSAVRATRVAEQVLRALGALHLDSVLHCDLKPSNVILCESAAVLCDFGSAVFLSQGAASPPSFVTGTPATAAPEVIEGERPDERSDVYGAGLLLYCMLAGHLPFWDDDLTKVCRMVMKDDPVPLRVFRGDCPADLEAVAMCALQKRPANRYPSVGEMLVALRATASFVGVPQ